MNYCIPTLPLLAPEWRERSGLHQGYLLNLNLIFLGHPENYAEQM